MKKLSLALKLYAGFASVLGLLALLSVIVLVKLASIRSESTTYAAASQLDGFVAAKISDHLRWTGKIKAYSGITKTFAVK